MSRLTHSSPAWHLPALTGMALLCGVGVAWTLPERGLDNAAGFQIFLGISVLWSGLALAAASRGGPRCSGYVLLAAALIRLALLRTPESLSDDLFRYLWEGRVANAGFNPFFHAPLDPVLASLRDASWARVNHPDVPTVYPPGALLLFRAAAAAGFSPLAWRFLCALADFGVLLALVALSRARGLGAWAPTLYALHPLPALESASNGHLESFALLFWALAMLAWERRRLPAALVALAAGALVKLLPAVAALTLLRGERPGRGRGLLLALALGLAVSLPLLSLGGASGAGAAQVYDSWAFNATFFRAIQLVLPDPLSARRAGVAIGALWCLFALWRRRDPVALSLDVAGALLLLSPVVHPWYALWAFVPALLLRSLPWVVFASAVLLSYSVLLSYDPIAQTGWKEPSWLIWSQILPFVVALCTRRCWPCRGSGPDAP